MKKHRVGKTSSRKKRRSPAKLHAAHRALGAAKEAVWNAYHAGKLTSKEMNDRANAIEGKRMDIDDERKIPYFRQGDTVRHVRGEHGRVTGVIPAEYRSSPMYRVVRGQERGEEIHDIWPEETLSRAGPK